MPRQVIGRAEPWSSKDATVYTQAMKSVKTSRDNLLRKGESYYRFVRKNEQHSWCHTEESVTRYGFQRLRQGYRKRTVEAEVQELKEGRVWLHDYEAFCERVETRLQHKALKKASLSEPCMREKREWTDEDLAGPLYRQPGDDHRDRLYRALWWVCLGCGGRPANIDVVTHEGILN